MIFLLRGFRFLAKFLEVTFIILVNLLTVGDMMKVWHPRGVKR